MQNLRIKDVDVDIHKILGREVAEPDSILVSINITDKVVMVTGAGGSIGSEICRQAMLQRPSILILYELNEYALYSTHTELIGLYPNQKIIPILGSVMNRTRLDTVMNRFQVNTVYHAAAYKHVPMVEYNMTEGLLNNFIGTTLVVDAAIDCGVQTFVLVSTDKAVRPANIMGASKRLSEMYVQSVADYTLCNFSMVRFGNVLGSSGSVLPVFMNQISNGKPLSLTSREMTRYFMSIPEAAQLVIQAGAMAVGGEVFVLDMGNPVRIEDMARNLNKMFNRPENLIELTGLRPGEKLYEELLIGDNAQPTSHPLIMKAQEPFPDSENMDKILRKVRILCDSMEYNMLLEFLRETVIGFNHNGIISDCLYHEYYQSH